MTPDRAEQGGARHTPGKGPAETDLSARMRAAGMYGLLCEILSCARGGSGVMNLDDRGGWSMVPVEWRRTYDERMPPWLVTIYGVTAFGPQARGVVDDFGNLQVVTRWQ